MGIHDPKTDLGPLAQAVAAELGADWTATELGAGFMLAGDGIELFMRADSYYGGKRAEISISYPDGAYNVLRYDEKTDAYPQTSVALDRPPAAVARQIERKLIPVAREWTATVTERLERNGKSAQRRVKLAAEIERRLPGSRLNGDDSVTLGAARFPWYGDVKIYHDADRASVDVRGITPAQLLAILEVLATTD